MEAVILGKLTEVAQTQASAAQSQAVTSERLAAVLERIDDHLGRMDTARQDSVASIKDHVDGAVATATEARSRADRRTALLLGALVMLAEITRAGIDQLLHFMGKG
jgi:hypothetical protein